jgi:TPR repeat protein
MRTGNRVPLGFALISPSLAYNDASLRAYEEGKYTKAFREWQVLAEKGDVEAQFRLGAMFEKGKGTRRTAW